MLIEGAVTNVKILFFYSGPAPQTPLFLVKIHLNWAPGDIWISVITMCKLLKTEKHLKKKHLPVFTLCLCGQALVLQAIHVYFHKLQ